MHYEKLQETVVIVRAAILLMIREPSETMGD